MRPGASEARATAGDLSAPPRSGVLAEAVAHRAHGGDRRDARGDRQLAAQVTDVDVDDVALAAVPLTPYRLQKPLAAEHLASVAQQIDEQVELRTRQQDRLAVPAHRSRQ